MNKLLFPAMLVLIFLTPSAHAGYWAFHEDVQDQIEDIVHNRPDDDDDTDCEEDGADPDACAEDGGREESHEYPWQVLLELLSLFGR